uniref:Uncharacterized protein n=1 Tax=Molossus molossus TaxID=27622 RepID=A0A7J8BYC7_MOLMO|nr:hypothetical protein HJG59_010019 [Molossus molossus]
MSKRADDWPALGELHHHQLKIDALFLRRSAAEPSRSASCPSPHPLCCRLFHLNGAAVFFCLPTWIRLLSNTTQSPFYICSDCSCNTQSIFFDVNKLVTNRSKFNFRGFGILLSSLVKAILKVHFCSSAQEANSHQK